MQMQELLTFPHARPQYRVELIWLLSNNVGCFTDTSSKPTIAGDKAAQEAHVSDGSSIEANTSTSGEDSGKDQPKVNKLKSVINTNYRQNLVKDMLTNF